MIIASTYAINMSFPYVENLMTYCATIDGVKKCRRDDRVFDTAALYGMEDTLKVQAHGAGFTCKHDVDVRIERVGRIYTPNVF